MLKYPSDQVGSLTWFLEQGDSNAQAGAWFYCIFDIVVFGLC